MKIVIFTHVKNRCILHGRVCVMLSKLQKTLFVTVTLLKRKQICNNRFIKAFLNMSLVVRKAVFGVFDLVRHKPGCVVTEDG